MPLTLLLLYELVVKNDDEMLIEYPLTKQHDVLCANDADLFFLELYGCALNNSRN